MEKNIRLGYLYDFYGELLPEHGREILGSIVEDDLSLSELSEMYGITRQGVHDVKKRCAAALEKYESKLHLLEKYLSSKELVSEIKTVAESRAGDVQMKEISELCDRLMENI